MTPISYLLPPRRARRATARASKLDFQPVLCPAPARPKARRCTVRTLRRINVPGACDPADQHDRQPMSRRQLRNLRTLAGTNSVSRLIHLCAEGRRDKARTARAREALLLAGMTPETPPVVATSSPVTPVAPPAPRVFNRDREKIRRTGQIIRNEWRRHAREYRRGLVEV